MAQKAAKALAARNKAILNRTLLITLGVHGFFLLFRIALYRDFFHKWTHLLYTIFSAPSLLIQFWFERIGRPQQYPNGDLRRSGEDLKAKGLTDWMWDVLYWTYGCIVLAALLGDYAWWFWAVVPTYSAWLAYTTFASARSGMAGFQGSDSSKGQTTSKRQQKLDQRGGQKIRYR